MFYKQTKISDSSEVIYTTSKNDLKMMWLSRNTKVMDSFSPQKQEFFWESYCDKHKWHPHHTRQKNYGLYTITCLHNIARVNCHTCTYFFLKQNGLEFRKKYCFVKKLDNVLCCAESAGTIAIWSKISVPDFMT